VATSDNGQELYFDLTLTSASVRFIMGLLENHRKYREDGITLLREKWGNDARTGFVEGEMLKAQRAMDEITSQCLLD
jgi:hypothetical protein